MSEDRASDAFWAHYPRDFVMVEGVDALSYLHSQMSQDIQSLAVGASAWTLLLQPTGKVDVLARVLRSGDAAYVFDVDAGAGDALVARLLRFKIRVKADVSVIPWRCIAVRGVAATAIGRCVRRDRRRARGGTILGWVSTCSALHPSRRPACARGASRSSSGRGWGRRGRQWGARSPTRRFPPRRA